MRIEVDSDYQVEDLDWVEVKHSSVVQEAAYFVVDPSDRVSLLVLALAFLDIAEPERDSGFDSIDCCFGSFAGSAAAEGYVSRAVVDQVLVPVVQLDYDLIQVSFD